jgi:hypothetical protein
MRILTEEQRQLISQFIDGDILADELIESLGPTPLDIPSLLIALLESAVASGNAEEAEGAFALIYSFKNDKAFRKQAVPLLISLLQMEGHYRHEDIVSVLQRAKDARAVNAIYDTTLSTYEYLNYDDSFALARKCTWALADTGNEEAYQKLQLLAANSNAQIAGYARKRIELWEKEQDRKAFRFLP